MEFAFPIQNVFVAHRLASKLWFISEEFYYTPALALQLCDFQNNIEEFSRSVFRGIRFDFSGLLFLCVKLFFSRKIYVVISYLIANTQTYTLAIIKSRQLTYPCDNMNSDSISQKFTIRAVIYLRKPRDLIPDNERNIIFALSELCGQFLVPGYNFYTNY